jgi:long-chain acyl-CoA synthetase
MPTTRSPSFDEAAFAGLDPAFIRFSSGTTGQSKGIILSHRAIAERIAAVNQGLRISPADRVVWFLPMAHHFVASVLLFLEYGATIVISPSHLARDVLDVAAEHHATVLYGAPYHYALLAAEPAHGSLDSLRMAVCTAASLPLDTASAFERRFGLPLTQAYGLIEMGLPVMNLVRARQKPDAVGRPLPGYEIRLRDEQGREVRGQEVGEVLLRGPGMLDGYLTPWQRRDELAPDGWFATGDLGWVDDEGDLRLVGRTRSVISVAGLKCFPEEIEAALLTHPSVRAARVVPEPHPRLGSVPVAEVVPLDRASPPATSELSSHCRARLARFKVPIEFRIVDTIAETASGKVKRA